VVFHFFSGAGWTLHNLKKAGQSSFQRGVYLSSYLIFRDLTGARKVPEESLTLFGFGEQ
jgi:hypothetical protein